MQALAWTDEGFTLAPYDLVFLPGGHEKGVVQVINSPVTHKLLVDYFPQTRKPSKKNVAAICHGVMVLSESSLPDGKSVLHDATTTALPGFMEQSIFWGTRLFLGDCKSFEFSYPLSLLFGLQDIVARAWHSWDWSRDFDSVFEDIC